MQRRADYDSPHRTHVGFVQARICSGMSLTEPRLVGDPETVQIDGQADLVRGFEEGGISLILGIFEGIVRFKFDPKTAKLR